LSDRGFIVERLDLGQRAGGPQPTPPECRIPAMATPTELERHAGALYAGRLAEFVAERNRLAAHAKVAGDAKLAAAIKALPKPSATAWAIDQLWWHERNSIDPLFAAAAELRAALVGGAGPQEATRARTQHRDRVTFAAGRAGDRLAASGHNVSIAIKRRIATTLEALAALGRWPDPGPGCLAGDLDPPGFDALGDAFDALGGAPSVPHGDDAPTESGANGDEPREDPRIAAAEAELRDAAALVDRRTREHDEAEAARASAEDEHTNAAARVREAERERDRLRSALSAAEDRARRGAEALQVARAARERAEAALTRLRAKQR
jgi:hypothetical protein